jgi:hypothetical protein
MPSTPAQVPKIAQSRIEQPTRLPHHERSPRTSHNRTTYPHKQKDPGGHRESLEVWKKLVRRPATRRRPPPPLR